MKSTDHLNAILWLVKNRIDEEENPYWREHVYLKQWENGGSFNEDDSYDTIAEQVVALISPSVKFGVVYSSAAADILIDRAVYHITGQHLNHPHIFRMLREGFVESIEKGVLAKRYCKQLLEFDLDRLSKVLNFGRDREFTLLGIQSIWDRYLIHINEKRIETPQYMFMRIAMGLCEHEPNKDDAAIKLYHLMSSLKYMPSSPTLFNAGTQHQQLSSCFISTTEDCLQSIFKTIYDNAMLAKWSGGIGNDWTNVRGQDARIDGTNGKSSGIIPFIKVVNSTTAAVNQGGKRAGAAVVYIEPWHIDLYGFLELRKNVGEERRRAHDLHMALWTPDLFFERVKSDGTWSLFCPSEAVGLHDSYGKAFNELYEKYEEMGRAGKLKLYKEVSAKSLWREIMTAIFSTGHPWITFKDPANIRNPQRHEGVIHSSNLCTEIFLNTSKEEVAVCNLGSINLFKHLTKNHEVDWDMLKETVYAAIRALDNVVSINFHPIEETARSSRRHRPVGLGVCGLADMMIRMGICWDEEGVEFSDRLMEFISYHAILASHELSKERGSYPSFEGSDWSKGVLPIDTQVELKKIRSDSSTINTESRMDWEYVRGLVKEGMRNSTLLAIAPTATISHLLGVNDSIAPYYAILYSKETMTGSKLVLPEVACDLFKEAGIMGKGLVSQLEQHDGSLQKLEVSQKMKDLLKSAFEVSYEHMIEAAARRQKWIDQGQSLNLFFSGSDGDLMNRIYMKAYEVGLKSTYYFKMKEASSIEKGTVNNPNKRIVRCDGCGT